jgi:molybdenum-dependent DNA-binding transcriptional regulator ModE
MGHSEQYMKGVQTLVDYLKANPDSRLCDAAKDLGMKYPEFYNRYRYAVKAGLARKRKFRRGPKGHRERILQEAHKVADCLKAHPNFSIHDAARALGMKYSAVQYKYTIAVEQGLVEQQKPYHEKIVQEAQNVADYVKTHPNLFLADAARALGLSYPNTINRYKLAVRQGFVKKQKFRGRKKGATARVAKLTDIAVGLRSQSKTLEEVGQGLGVTRERARQILKTAIGLGKMTEQQYKGALRHRGGLGRWQYFLDFARNIRHLDSGSYPELLKTHFDGLARDRQSGYAGRYERSCLDDLVENGSLSCDDAASIGWLIWRLKRSPMPLRRLKAFSKDAVKRGMTREKLAFKYGFASRGCLNPANSVRHVLYFAMELGLIAQDDYEAKARETLRGPPRKYSLSAIEEVIRKHDRTGKPYAVLAREAGIPAGQIYRYHADNREKSDNKLH